MKKNKSNKKDDLIKERKALIKAREIRIKELEKELAKAKNPVEKSLIELKLSSLTVILKACYKMIGWSKNYKP